MDAGKIKSIPVEYRPIPGHNGYVAGSDGSICTLWTQRGTGYAGKIIHFIGTKQRPLRPTNRKEGGRKRYTLRRDAGGYRRAYGSTFVLEAFVGPCPTGMECCISMIIKRKVWKHVA